MDRASCGVNTASVKFPPAINFDPVGFCRQRLPHVRLFVLYRDRDAHDNPPDSLGVLQVVVNALLICGYQPTPFMLRRYTCRDDWPADMVDYALRMSPPYPYSNAQAGRLIGLLLDDVTAIQAAEDKALTMEPIDETAHERTARRQARADEKHAARQRRYKAKRQAERDIATRVTVQLDIEDRDRHPEPATLQRDRIVVAIGDGAMTATEIAEAAGLAEQTVRPWLSRLLKAGEIERVARGQYAVPGAAAPAGGICPVDTTLDTAESGPADCVGAPDTMPAGESTAVDSEHILPADPEVFGAAPKTMPANPLPALYLLALTEPAEIVGPRRHRRASTARRCLSSRPRKTHVRAARRGSRACCTGPPIRLLLHSTNDHRRGHGHEQAHKIRCRGIENSRVPTHARRTS